MSYSSFSNSIVFVVNLILFLFFKIPSGIRSIKGPPSLPILCQISSNRTWGYNLLYGMRSVLCIFLKNKKNQLKLRLKSRLKSIKRKI